MGLCGAQPRDTEDLDLLSRFGEVFQMGVDLIEPVSISQLLSGRHISFHLCIISHPRQFYGFGVELIGTAHQNSFLILNSFLRKT